MRIAVLLASLVLLTALTSSTAHARTERSYFNSEISLRIDALIGFTPTPFGIHPRGKPVRPIQARVGGRTYRVIFDTAAAVVAPDIGIYMRNVARSLKYATLRGSFLDRRLTARERKQFKVRADLGRDADVLVTSQDHPACSSGVSRSTVKRIAAGSIRTWSAAGVPTPESGDSISLRRATNAAGDQAEPRFGATYKKPRGARLVRDGGLSEAASGDQSIAAVTSWSRARAYSTTTCAVPVGGSAPTDQSVRALTHRDAYPITFITPRWKNPPRIITGITAAFVKFVSGRTAAEQFRQRGMLPAKGAWPGE
jgi:hypothetical protein